MYISVGVKVYFSCNKGEFEWFFDRLILILVARKENLIVFLTGLTVRSKNLDPTGRSTRPVSISGMDG